MPLFSPDKRWNSEEEATCAAATCAAGGVKRDLEGLVDREHQLDEATFKKIFIM